MIIREILNQKKMENKMEQSKYFLVDLNKEHVDSGLLIDKIKEDRWMDSSTIIVNCSPDYSSRLVQLVNHKLSFLNKNELCEVIPLEMPYPNMSQIFNPYSHDYEMFDRYMAEWVKQNINDSYKYLFIDSGTLRGKNFNKVKIFIRPKLEPNQFRFASLYVQSSSIFTPDYYVEKFDKETQGGLLFQWENMDNPNWDY